MTRARGDDAGVPDDDLFTIVPVIVGVAFALVLTFVVVSVVRGLVTSQGTRFKGFQRAGALPT